MERDRSDRCTEVDQRNFQQIRHLFIFSSGLSSNPVLLCAATVSLCSANLQRVICVLEKGKGSI